MVQNCEKCGLNASSCNGECQWNQASGKCQRKSIVIFKTNKKIYLRIFILNSLKSDTKSIYQFFFVAFALEFLLGDWNVRELGQDKGTVSCARHRMNNIDVLLMCTSSSGSKQKYTFQAGILKSDQSQEIEKPHRLVDSQNKVQLDWGQGKFWIKTRQYFI